jgi:hypothetical protein
MRHPFFHVGFVVPDLDVAMNEFGDVLGVEWRPILQAPLQLLGPDGVAHVEVRSVYTTGGPPAIELFESVPRTALAGSDQVSFHHIGLWADDLGQASRDLDAKGWMREGTVANAENEPSRFTMQRSPHGFYVELLETGFPRPYLAGLVPQTGE